jgi:hypothetical protein
MSGLTSALPAWRSGALPYVVAVSRGYGGLTNGMPLGRKGSELAPHRAALIPANRAALAEPWRSRGEGGLVQRELLWQSEDEQGGEGHQQAGPQEHGA